MRTLFIMCPITGGVHATLLTIDTQSLTTTNIGSLGINIAGADGLTFTDPNNLHATFSIGNKYGFYSIDVLTGNATSIKAD